MNNINSNSNSNIYYGEQEANNSSSEAMTSSNEFQPPRAAKSYEEIPNMYNNSSSNFNYSNSNQNNNYNNGNIYNGNMMMNNGSKKNVKNVYINATPNNNLNEGVAAFKLNRVPKDVQRPTTVINIPIKPRSSSSSSFRPPRVDSWVSLDFFSNSY